MRHYGVWWSLLFRHGSECCEAWEHSDMWGSVVRYGNWSVRECDETRRHKVKQGDVAVRIHVRIQCGRRRWDTLSRYDPEAGRSAWQFRVSCMTTSHTSRLPSPPVTDQGEGTPSLNDGVLIPNNIWYSTILLVHTRVGKDWKASKGYFKNQVWSYIKWGNNHYKTERIISCYKKGTSSRLKN